MTGELNKIKKMYGENFAKLCRKLFPTILEEKGKLTQILADSFSGNSRNLYNDIVENGLEVDLKDYIYNKIIESQPKEDAIDEKRNPYELLDEAGYELTECLCEDEIQKFKKYYAPGEELCTFQGERLEERVVYFAVRKDVEEIKRENFKNPERDDRYGTSVMSIQFLKEGTCVVYILNRYNHTIHNSNPDATYGNDLNRIIPGLTQSFTNLLKERGLNLNSCNVGKFEIPDYVVANDGKYYKYNTEINGTYYCPGNIVIKNQEPHKLENPEKQLLVDNFIIDFENKTIKAYDSSIKDSFIDGLQDIEKIEIINDKETKSKKIFIQQKNQEETAILELNKDNQIIGYENKNLTELGDDFLKYNRGIKRLNLANVKKIGDDALYSSMHLNHLSLSNVEEIGNNFLRDNGAIAKLNLPNVKKVGNNFLKTNRNLSQLNMQNLEEAGDGFLNRNSKLEQLELLNLKSLGNQSLMCADKMKSLNLPKVEQIGNSVLEYNEEITQLNLSSVKQIGNDFLSNNRNKIELNIPSDVKVGEGFLAINKKREIIKKKLSISILNIGKRTIKADVQDKSLISKIFDKFKNKSKETENFKDDK